MLTVHKLIHSHHKSWNWDIIKYIFNEEDIEAIKRTPLFDTTTEDKLIWPLEKNGVYSVKSPYKRLMQNFTTQFDLHVPGNWRLLWFHQSSSHPHQTPLQSSVNWGLCIKNEAGFFIIARTAWSNQPLYVSEGEAMGHLLAIQWLQELVVSHVIIDMDCKIVVDKLRVSFADHSD
ncbi:hypothetical protein JHK87_054291 [Glycine soja]|nr:hypothetical protein JHK87_054291 [Glycine soja]